MELTLKEARKKQSATMDDIQVLTKICPAILSGIETKGHKPNAKTRRRLELILGKIDFDSQVQWKPRTVKETEIILRKLVEFTYGLTANERVAFIQTMVETLEKLKERFPKHEIPGFNGDKASNSESKPIYF